MLDNGNYYRSFGATKVSLVIPELKQVYLACYTDKMPCRNVTIDDRAISHYGFVRCGTFPRDPTGNSIALASLPDDLVIVVYANDYRRVRFAVALGQYRDKGWVHVVCDKPGDSWSQWEDYAKET